MRVANVGSSRRHAPVELDRSLVYDFLLSPIVARPVASGADEFEATAAWQAVARLRGGDALLDELERLTGSRALLHHELLALAALAPDEPKEVLAFLEAVELASPEEVAALVLEDSATEDEAAPEPAALTAALAGDRAAAASLLARREGVARRRMALWLADPAGARADLLAMLRQWYAAVFAPEVPRLQAILDRDALAKERIQAQAGADGLLRAVGGTLQLVFGPGTRRVVVAPAVLSRPAIVLVERAAQGRQLVICPVADDSLEEPEPLAPPPALLRLYKALSDDTRLRILRLVAHDELYATEIAERLGIAKATVSHHMVLLRAAGLVAVRGDRGTERYYALHRPALDEPGARLRRYLGV